MNKAQLIWLYTFLMSLPVVGKAQLTYAIPNGNLSYAITNGSVTITGVAFPFFPFPAGPVTIPSSINGLPVTSIGGGFSGIFGFYLTSITIPGSVTSIGDYAFEDDADLTSIYFEGNAPACGTYTFETHADQDIGQPLTPSSTTAYYYAGTSGWDDQGAIWWAFALDGVGLVMLNPPSITSQPTAQIVAEGATATFTVAAAGPSPIGYQWQWNGTNLANGGGVSGVTTPTLTIVNVQGIQNGYYAAVVTNQVGSTLSATAILTVDTPPAITSQPASQTIAAGGAASFAVSATGTGPLLYQWRHSGTNLADGGVFSGSATPTLSVNNAQATSAGSYAVVVSSALGSVTSAPAALVVELPPSFTSEPTNLTVAIGTTATFTAVAGGTPPLGYQWQVHGTNLLNNNRISGSTTPSLRITDAQISDGGLYSVLITNSVGSGKSSAPATLSVIDVTPPKLTIGAPASGQTVSNAAFTVTGLASDNVAVASVTYQLNGVGFRSAQTANGWSNWSAAVTLTPGVNTLQVCAVDTSGNVSATNTVTFTFVLSAPLTIHITGQGTVSPNYNGQLLQIGKTYSMTASPASGFAFTNWTGSATTNKPTLSFLMASNLSFTANFVDVQKPTLSITAPKSGQSVSNALFTASGTASDNIAVAAVYYRLNGSPFQPAQAANNWSNWTASLTLSPGQNTFTAYAVDTSGNVSPTNTVTVTYVLSAPLSVHITGQGTVSPNYNGQLLQIGKTYSMTAAPASGFAFTNWTGSATTNKPTLSFLMASNLSFTANFIDIQPPALSITAPKSSQSVSNALFTASGTASDNVDVAAVYYKLNGSTFQPAQSASNWSNWTASLTLSPGRNTLTAYAVDTSGNVSPTNTVTVTYVLSAPLTVHLTGQGTVSPKYNGQLLQIGKTYSMTASPASGFAFTNWTGSAATNNPTLSFLMASNLSFTAHFVDVQKPTLSISTPKPGQTLSNALFTVAGVASDNVAVASVFYQLNGAGFRPAQSANGWTNWTAPVTLTPGANTLQAYAVDTSGNVSPTSTVNFTCAIAVAAAVASHSAQAAPPARVQSHQPSALESAESTAPPSRALIQSVLIPVAPTRATLVGGVFSLEVQSQIGATYTLESTDSLGAPAWTPLQTLSGTGGPLALADPNARPPARFYRVRVGQ